MRDTNEKKLKQMRVRYVLGQKKILPIPIQAKFASRNRIRNN